MIKTFSKHSLNIIYKSVYAFLTLCLLDIFLVWKIYMDAIDKLINNRKFREEFGFLDKCISMIENFFNYWECACYHAFHRGISTPAEIIEKTGIFRSAMRCRKDITQYQGRSWIACSRISTWQYAATAPVVTYLPIYLSTFPTFASPCCFVHSMSLNVASGLWDGRFK